MTTTNPNKLSSDNTVRIVSPRATLIHYVTKHQAAPVERAGYRTTSSASPMPLTLKQAARLVRRSLVRAYCQGRSASYLGI